MEETAKMIRTFVITSLVGCSFINPVKAKNIDLHLFEIKCYTLEGKEVVSNKETLSKKATCFDLGKLSFADAIENLQKML